MTLFGYHASHEQFAPSELLRCVVAAEDAGFKAAMCSDHFLPWSERQGQSGFAWSWLGAALQATSLPFGVVTAPGWRFHPALIAQAAATLAEMYPGRFWMAAGSGEALNEHITGEAWAPKAERNARLKESVEVIQRLFKGESVTHYGHVTVEEATLYTRPTTPPLVVGAAITAETARWLGGWADGMITVSQPFEKLKKVVEAFREGGGEGKRLLLQVKLSYARDEESALQGAYEQWRTNVFPSNLAASLRLPAEFDAAAQFVKPEDMHEMVHISSEPGRHAEWLARCAEFGFDEIYLHNVHREQRRFIERFGESILPQL